MALASINDVKRVLRIATTDVDAERDAQLSGSLEAAEDWVSRRVRIGYDQTGPQTAKFYDIMEDARLRIPADGPDVTAVRAYAGPDSDGILLYPDTAVPAMSGYTDEGNYVRLRPNLRTSPFEGALGERLPQTWARVEVDYTPTGSVPKALRDGTAYLAAGLWRASPALLAQLESEKIGDYSYKMMAPANSADAGDDPVGFVGLALTMIRPFIKKTVFVV